MGYVPMIAADPLQAKYFQAQYHAGYLRAALLYTPSYMAFVYYLPLLIVVAFDTRKMRYALLLFIGLGAIIVSLNRAYIGISIIIGLGIVVADRCSRKMFAAYLSFGILLILIGAIGNYVLTVYLDVNMGSSDPQEQLADLVENGSPDVDEGFRLLDSFEEHPHFTYGAQFVGGLVPVQSLTMRWIPLARYNPGFWAKGVIYGTDDQDFLRNYIAGGGPRIAVPISAYAAFGWLGVVAMSMLTGFLTGYLVRFAKSSAGRSSIEKSAIVIAMYFALSRLAENPVGLTTQQFPPIFMLAWLIYPVRPMRFW
jgi:hypothetical protein